MAIGVGFLLFFIVLSLGEITVPIARLRFVVSIVGIAALAAGAVFYMLARSRFPKERQQEMSATQEELITEEAAMRYLSVSPERLRELVAEGELRLVLAPGPEMLEPMCYRGEVLRLKERLRGQESQPEAEEWPNLIGE